MSQLYFIFVRCMLYINHKTGSLFFTPQVGLLQGL